MIRNVMHSNQKLYSRLLLYITLCVAFTMIASTIVYYLYYNQFLKKQAFQNDLASLESTSSVVTNMTETAEALSYQIYRNSTISKLMFYNEPGIYDETAAMLELNNYLRTMPYIESIYVNNQSNRTFYIASNREQNGIYNQEEVVDTGIVEILQNVEDYKPFTPIPRKYLSSDGEQISVYSFLCFDAIGRSRGLNSAVVVNLSSSWINNSIIGNATTSGFSFIVDDRGRTLHVDTLDELEMDEQSARTVQQQISKVESGYFVDDFLGEKSLLSYSSPDALDWQYVQVTPYTSITSHTSKIRNMTIMLAALVLGIGLFMSFLLSRRLYVPFRQVLSQNHSLEVEKRNGMFTVKQNTLRNMVRAKGGWNPRLAGQYKELGITVSLTEPYYVVLLSIDRFGILMQERGASILPYKFAMMNIASEVCSQAFRVETVDMDEDSVLLFMNRTEGSILSENELMESVIRQIQEASEEYLKISLSAVYSSAADRPEQLREYHKHTKEAMKYRFFYGEKSVICGDTIAAYQSYSYIYPADKENKYVELLMEGKIEDAKHVFADMLLATESYPYQAVELAYSRLSLTTSSVLDNIQKRNGFTLSFEEIPSLHRYESLAECIGDYHQRLDEVQLKLLDKRSDKQLGLMKRMNEMIEHRYIDPALSLQQIAEELQMSPVYLGRIYKQHHLKTVVDAINEERIKNACQLLMETDDSIGNIAEKVGFTSSSYFHRMFKRFYSITPTDYRRSRQVDA
ncbi:AraC family transcriptional regulator [Paenibacillus sp. GYB006]|uniref:AraC family transcriptional regulator n=1 Tax=Paenibacillus sp. GYB006 TaxID=2994394 RepID=UPI002F96C5F2